MDNKVTQRRLLQRRKKCIVSTVARISSEQVRVRRVREPSAHAYIPGRSASRWGCHCSGDALAVGMNYSEDDRNRTSEWGCHLSGDAILWR